MAVLGIFLLGFGYAQPKSEAVETRSVLISVPCYKNAVALSVLLGTQYGEIPIAESIGNMRWFNGSEEREMFGVGMMFANSETKSYSNVIVFQDGSACIVGTGVDFKPLR